MLLFSFDFARYMHVAHCLVLLGCGLSKVKVSIRISNVLMHIRLSMSKGLYCDSTVTYNSSPIYILYVFACLAKFRGSFI